MAPLTNTIDIRAIPNAGYAVRVQASPTERQAIAKEFGLVEVRSLVGDLEVRREAGDSVSVRGRVEAQIVQNCVVSFEPVEQSIDEAIAVEFVESDSLRAPSVRKSGAEVFVDPNAEPPDILTGDQIDLGAVLLEHFSLGIDPYPRAPGAEAATGIGDPTGGASDSPFAVLGKLVDRS